MDLKLVKLAIEPIIRAMRTADRSTKNTTFNHRTDMNRFKLRPLALSACLLAAAAFTSAQALPDKMIKAKNRLVPLDQYLTLAAIPKIPGH